VSQSIRCEIAPGLAVGDGCPLLVMSGPCVAESEALCLAIAAELKAVCARLGLGYVFKASYDKANRTSGGSFRGQGLEGGLAILRAVKQAHGVPIVTDVHEVAQVEAVAEVADILQIPAFLCRQTDLLLAAGRTGKVVNIKKGQFCAPGDMRHAVDKVRSTGNPRVLLTERGTTFGYHNLVVDMRALPIMRGHGVPVIFDATHSVQLPGGQGGASGGQREFVAPLLRAACAVGLDGLFLESHPNPAAALSDGPNSIPLAEMAELLRTGRQLHDLCRPRA
jgi:2-dehydro-3-deoxyphosphooctonate aldolase (KDO 8-P synthase)